MSEEAIVIVDFSNFVHTCWWPAVAAEKTDPNKYNARDVFLVNMAGKISTITNDLHERGLSISNWLFVEDGVPAAKIALYPLYKADRERPEPDSAPDKGYAKQWLISQGFRDWALGETCEADDTIAAVAELLAKAPKQRPVVIVSSDKDLWQLISKGIEVYSPTKGQFVTAALIKDKFGFERADLIPLHKSLWGDSGDNVPNVVPRMQKQLMPLLESCNGTIQNFFEIYEQYKHGLSPRCRDLVDTNLDKINRNWQLVKLSPNLDFVWENVGPPKKGTDEPQEEAPEEQ